jgi:hypothetical protein
MLSGGTGSPMTAVRRAKLRRTLFACWTIPSSVYLVEPKSRGAPARPLDTAISRKKPIGAAIKMKWATHYFVFSTLIIDYTKQGKAVLAGLCAGDRTPRATPPVSEKLRS